MGHTSLSATLASAAVAHEPYTQQTDVDVVPQWDSSSHPDQSSESHHQPSPRPSFCRVAFPWPASVVFEGRLGGRRVVALMEVALLPSIL